MSFDSWCLIRAHAVRRQLDAWEQDRLRAWLLHESRNGWWTVDHRHGRQWREDEAA